MWPFAWLVVTGWGDPPVLPLGKTRRNLEIVASTALFPLAPSPDPCCPAKGDLSDEDDDNEFFDAPEIITLPESMGHK